MGTMHPARVPKFSDGLRLIGFTIWIPSLLLLIGATLVYLLLVGTSSMTAPRVTLEEKLRRIDGVSPSFIERAKDGIVEEEDWNRLATRARPTVERVIREHALAEARAASGGPAAVLGAGGCGLAMIYIVLLPAFIVGLVLVMKRNVWKCTHCTYIYDRA